MRLLGKGGMSDVYEAENTRLGSHHAVKLFTYESLADNLSEDSEASPFDHLTFGGEAYMQMGENEPLRQLLLRAAEKLRILSDR